MHTYIVFAWDSVLISRSAGPLVVTVNESTHYRSDLEPTWRSVLRLDHRATFLIDIMFYYVYDYT